MPLRGIKPESVQKRLKMLVYGPAGVGKTTASIQFPNAYLIDMEKGSQNYADTIKKSGSMVYETNNPDDVKAEVLALLTEKHQFKTVIIDPVTALYGGLQEKWNRIFEKYATSQKQSELQDFGFRYWARVKSDYKSIMRMLTALDCNLIVTSHQKDVYGTGMVRVGVGPDSMKGDEYVFDYVLQLENVDGKRMARTIKERAEIGKNKFPEAFEWSYQNFCKFYGQEAMERGSTPIKLATPKQVEEIKKLIELVNLGEDTISKWLTKEDVEDFSEMDTETITKYIAAIRKKLDAVKGEK
jgi:GTPase SAR1 family protein